MAKPKSLHISIHKPCTAAWEEMHTSTDGRFCSNCQKTVIDFTKSSDRDIFKILKSNKQVCGRFYPDQVNRTLVITSQKRSYHKLARIAASFFAFIAFKQATASGSDMNNNVVTSPLFKQNKSGQFPDKIIISGTVKDNTGAPFENVTITIGPLTVMSGKDGKFEVEITGENAGKSLTLKVSYDGFVTVTRNYHPAMQSTSYDIVLSPPGKYRPIIMGGITTDDDVEFPVVIFKWPVERLTDENKAMLATVANTMRNHPGLVIQLSGCGKTQKEINKRDEQLRALKSFFIDKEGISGDRIKLGTLPYSLSKINTVEISKCKKEE